MSNAGDIQFQNGKAIIHLDNKGTTEPFDIAFVCNRMRKAIASYRGFYSVYIRRMIAEMKTGSIDSLPTVRERLKILMADKRQGISQLSKQWDSWMASIYNFRNVKTNSEVVPNGN